MLRGGGQRKLARGAHRSIVITATGDEMMERMERCEMRWDGDDGDAGIKEYSRSNSSNRGRGVAFW